MAPSLSQLAIVAAASLPAVALAFSPPTLGQVQAHFPGDAGEAVFRE